MSQIIYCDNAATTQTSPEVIEAMVEVLKNNFGNPSSLHKYGRKAKSLLDQARQQIANFLNCQNSEVFFTSGGTESNNISILGALEFSKKHNLNKNHFISAATEHSSVYKPLKQLEKQGYLVTWLKVNKEGFIDLEQLEASFRPNTLLVSIMHANNEIGVIQDLETIGHLCRKNNVLFHSDAVQSAGKIDLDIQKYKLDLVSISGHKFYGPKGIGILFKRQESPVLPILFGGTQEKSFKPGTESLANIVGLAKAFECQMAKMQTENMRLQKLQTQLIDKLLEIPKTILNGPRHLSKRITGNINISFEDLKSDALVLQLDLKNICISSGSACSEGSIEPSRIIKTLYPEQTNLAYNSLRFSLGSNNQESDIIYISETLSTIVQKLRKNSFTHN